jgi:hypothetical protein
MACCSNYRISLPVSGVDWFHAMLQLGVRDAVGLRLAHPQLYLCNSASFMFFCSQHPYTRAASSSLAWPLVP